MADFLEPDEDDDAEDLAPEFGEAEDLAALKDCLRALADAIASSNLAVISGAQGDMSGATARVQASIAALKRFHEAFGVLDGAAPNNAERAADDDED